MSTSPSSVVVSPGISSGVMSAGPTGVFYLGHPGTPISAPLPLVALAPLPPGGQLNPPVAGSNPSSPVVHGAGAPAVAGAGSGSSARVVRKPVSKMTDEEKFAEGICTRKHLRVITSSTGRFNRPPEFDSTALVSFDGPEEARAAMGALSYHHMIPLPEMVDLWSTLRAVYVDSCRAKEPIALHASLRLALIALIQLSSASPKGRERFRVKPMGVEFSQEERDKEECSMREDRFSDDLASGHLEELDSDSTTGKKSPAALGGLFCYLMWMDFNLIRGPSPRSRSMDPGSNFDRFENSIRKLRESRVFSESEETEVRRLEQRIQLVRKLYLAYSAYKELAAKPQSWKTKQSVDEALQKFCLNVLELKDWAKTREGLSLQVTPKELTYTLSGGAATTLATAYNLSLTFTSYLERSLWVKRPEDGKWAKLSDADDSVESPSPSGVVSPRRR